MLMKTEKLLVFIAWLIYVHLGYIVSLLHCIVVRRC